MTVVDADITADGSVGALSCRLLLDRREHRLAVRVLALVVADAPQVGGVELAEPRVICAAVRSS